jgi:hypothetical protein
LGKLMMAPRSLCTPGVCELGSIPENTGRNVAELQRDQHISRYGVFSRFDFTLVNQLEARNEWPEAPSSRSVCRSKAATGGAEATKGRRKSKPRDADAPKPGETAALQFVQWLLQRPENRFVVVCHHNFLQAVVGAKDRIANCSPFQARLHVPHASGTVASGSASSDVVDHSGILLELIPGINLAEPYSK